MDCDTPYSSSYEPHSLPGKLPSLCVWPPKDFFNSKYISIDTGAKIISMLVTDFQKSFFPSANYNESISASFACESLRLWDLPIPPELLQAAERGMDLILQRFLGDSYEAPDVVPDSGVVEVDIGGAKKQECFYRATSCGKGLLDMYYEDTTIKCKLGNLADRLAQLTDAIATKAVVHPSKSTEAQEALNTMAASAATTADWVAQQINSDKSKPKEVSLCHSYRDYERIWAAAHPSSKQHWKMERLLSIRDRLVDLLTNLQQGDFESDTPHKELQALGVLAEDVQLVRYAYYRQKYTATALMLKLLKCGVLACFEDLTLSRIDAAKVVFGSLPFLFSPPKQQQQDLQQRLADLQPTKGTPLQPANIDGTSMGGLNSAVQDEGASAYDMAEENKYKQQYCQLWFHAAFGARWTSKDLQISVNKSCQAGIQKLHLQHAQQYVSRWLLVKQEAAPKEELHNLAYELCALRVAFCGRAGIPAPELDVQTVMQRTKSRNIVLS